MQSLCLRQNRRRLIFNFHKLSHCQAMNIFIWILLCVFYFLFFFCGLAISWSKVIRLQFKSTHFVYIIQAMFVWKLTTIRYSSFVYRSMKMMQQKGEAEKKQTERNTDKKPKQHRSIVVAQFKKPAEIKPTHHHLYMLYVCEMEETKHRLNSIKFTPTQCFNLCAIFFLLSIFRFFQHLFRWIALVVILYLHCNRFQTICHALMLPNLRVISSFYTLCFFFARTHDYLWIRSNQFVYWMWTLNIQMRVDFNR